MIVGTLEDISEPDSHDDSVAVLVDPDKNTLFLVNVRTIITVALALNQDAESTGQSKANA